MRAEQKVLVLGDDTRSFLATVRSLGRQGIEVHAAPVDFRSPALKSRYISRIHRLPYYLGDGADWIAAVTHLFETERYDLVIPCDERFLIPLHRHRALFEPVHRLAIPDALAIETLNDKHNTRNLAQSVGVPVAAGRLVAAGDGADAVIAEFGLPVAIKPRQSYSPDKLYSRGGVMIAKDRAALARALDQAEPDEFFIEKFFAGDGVGLSILASRGKLLQAFEHHRVHEGPSAGAAYYRKSVKADPALTDACRRMVEAIGYTGVAMFEFKKNFVTGEWILLEVNARPWGSMPLPLGVGVDFPYRWYQLLVHGIETPPFDYPAEIYGRNFVPDCRYIIWKLLGLKSRPLQLAAFIGKSLAEYGRILTGREVHDVFVRDDKRPAFAEIAQLFTERLPRLIGLMPGAAHLRRRRSHRAFQQAVAGGAGQPATIVFVCQGNICRSSFAAVLLDSRLTDGHGVTVTSAGMLPTQGRPSPANAQEAARRVGVDLGAHRSQHLTPDLLAQASVLFVFDKKNRYWLDRRYPDIAIPVLPLADFCDETAGGGADIDDPDGCDVATFQETYRRIDNAVRGILAMLPVRTGAARKAPDAEAVLP